MVFLYRAFLMLINKFALIKVCLYIAVKLRIMKTYSEIIEIAKAQIVATCEAKKATVTFEDKTIENIWSESYQRMEIFFSGAIINYGDGDITSGASATFEVGFKTPSGYLSKKKIPVDTRNLDELTKSQVEELFIYQNEFRVNTYDPFYEEHEAQRRSNSGWNYVAQHFITDPWCTR